MEAFFSDIGLRIAYILLVVGVLVALGFAVFTIASDVKGAMYSVIGTAALLLIFIICYAMAGDEVLPKWTNYGVDSGLSKFIGALLNTGIVLFVMGVAVGLVGSVYTMVKKESRWPNVKYLKLTRAQWPT